MPFEITITETREVKKLCGKVWAVVGTKEEERESRYVSDDNNSKSRIADVYGYTPEVENTVTEKRDVLKQTVDALDLAAVIKAINKL